MLASDRQAAARQLMPHPVVPGGPVYACVSQYMSVCQLGLGD